MHRSLLSLPSLLLGPALVLLLAGTSSAQAYLVRDINSGAGGSNPVDLTAMGNTLFFTANNGVNGIELWKSDGTTGGTVMVLDINPGPADSRPNSLTVMNNTLFFSADNGVNGAELWKSDGTASGTVMVLDIRPGAGSSGPTGPVYFTVVGNTMFFRADNGVNGSELWKTDGTASGTVMVADINPAAANASPDILTVMGNTLFFRASDGVNGSELWKSDGTTAGTVLIADIRPGSMSSSLSGLTAMGNILLFQATDGVNGAELWKSDGTTAGTVLLLDISAGSASSGPTVFTVILKTMFFSATNGGANGRELWKSDGTTAGTVLVADVNPGSASSTPNALTPSGALLFFTADDGASGRELWQSASPWTAATTSRVQDINPGVAAGLQTGNGRLLSAADNIRILMAADNGVHGRELWKSDGTTAGTTMVMDIYPGPTSSDPTNYGLRRVGNLVFFGAGDGVNGDELWAVPLGAFGGALAEPFGSGCPGTGNFVPGISGVGGASVLGNASFGVRVSQGRASAPAVLLAHFLSGNLAVGGGCTFYLGLPVSLVLGTTTDGAGVATIPLGIPNDPSLVGGSVFFQWAVFDPNGAYLNLLSLSDGLHVVIGG